MNHLSQKIEDVELSRFSKLELYLDRDIRRIKSKGQVLVGFPVGTHCTASPWTLNLKKLSLYRFCALTYSNSPFTCKGEISMLQVAFMLIIVVHKKSHHTIVPSCMRKEGYSIQSILTWYEA